MKVLIVDHSAHRKTQSADFFIALLKERFEVEVFYYDRVYDFDASRAVADADLVVWWEFLPDRFRIFAPGKPNVFVPMYDNEWGSVWQWRRIAWSGTGVISFCEKVTRHARRCGVSNILDVKYFLDPADFQGMAGDPKNVLFWDRGGISEAAARKLFEGQDVNFIHKTSFLPRAEYLEFLKPVGVVIAPRLTEGIGMPVVEAMAMGKCVIANNDATMNEYLRDGETGVLFDAANPKPVSEETVLRARKNVVGAAAEFALRWKRDRLSILDFVAAQESCKPSCGRRLKMLFAYPLFALEGVLYRLFGARR